MRHRASRSVHGFSLVELLVVVGAIAVLASITLPALDGTMSAYRLRASADIIASELEAARVMAISRGALYEVHFNAHQVWVVDPQDPNNRPRIPKTLESGVQITAGSTVTFRPRGSASGVTINLRNETGATSVRVDISGKIFATAAN